MGAPKSRRSSVTLTVVGSRFASAACAGLGSAGSFSRVALGCQLDKPPLSV